MMERPEWLDSQWQRLVQNADSDRLGHAIMFSGPEGVGKHILADQLRKLALCSERQAPACGQCRSCQVAEAGNHPDDHQLIVPDDKATIGVDAVRALITNLSLSPTYQSRKVAMVYPAESMTTAAANALLKTLEEPPGETLIILISHAAWRLPATIISRCQMVRCVIPAKDVATAWLQAHFGEPDWDITLALASGGPLKAVEYKKQGVEKLYESTIEDLYDLRMGRNDVVSVAARWVDKDIQIRLQSLYMVIKLLALQAFDVDGELAHKSKFPALHNSVGQIKLSALLGYQDSVLKTQAKLETPLNRHLMLESLLMPWLSGFQKYELERVTL